MGTIDFAYQSIDVTTLTAKYLIDGLLRQRGGLLVLGRLLDRRPPGDGDVAELPAIFQWDRGQEIQSMISRHSSSARFGAWSKYWTSTTRRHHHWCRYTSIRSRTSPQLAEPILYPAFPVSDQSLFETALLQACDALDGVADGVIDNLPACRATFNPAVATYTIRERYLSLQCPGPKNPTCLSKAQISRGRQHRTRGRVSRRRLARWRQLCRQFRCRLCL